MPAKVRMTESVRIWRLCNVCVTAGNACVCQRVDLHACKGRDDRERAKLAFV
jgi:hypothetical protein